MTILWTIDHKESASTQRPLTLGSPSPRTLDGFHILKCRRRFSYAFTCLYHAQINSIKSYNCRVGQPPENHHCDRRNQRRQYWLSLECRALVRASLQV